MKFLELSSILKTNRLFNKLKELDPKINIDIEVYSCKQTKHQKSHRTIPKPFRFYVSALEMSFTDYDFSQETIESFKPTNFNTIKDELSYVFFRIYKNCEDVSNILHFIELILEQCVSLERSKFYNVSNLFTNESSVFRVFVIYDIASKRVLIIKNLEEK